ncbi:hypothetical protein [Streptomyces sp. AC04842]|uniref:hypothetical protein n=1 Tax=Streptomyces sp. AC04842 TaxID=2775327 RepID=UPI0020C62682|nr:hypothetical protein [Streptomyces sp. AC04842]
MSAVTTRGLVVGTTVGTGERRHTEATVVAHVGGSRAEALAELERRARAYVPAHPFHHDRRRLLRDGDGFLLVVDGAWRSQRDEDGVPVVPAGLGRPDLH